MNPISPIPPIPPALAPGSTAPALRLAPLGWIPTWIVGRRYYVAAPHPNAALPCERQPDNLSDPNAIAVYATRGGQVGHLPRYDAAYLAPLVDRGAIRLTARLAAQDDPHGRTAIRLEVWADDNAFTLAGPEADTAQAVWHAQFLALWSARARYSHHALDAFRTQLRDLAHAGGLWPETQILYRLLKGTVADGAAAEAQARELAAKLAAEAAAKAEQARKDAIRKAFACEPAGPLLDFGHLRVLPLRALQPATVTPLTQALREGLAVISPRAKLLDAGGMRLHFSGDARVLATQGERLDTTAGVFRVGKDTLLAPGDQPSTVPLWKETGTEDLAPVFLRGTEQAAPPLPVLPAEATGFAVFHGGELLHVNLFAHPFCADVALDALRRMTWHLKPKLAPLTAAAAAARVAYVLTHASIFGHDNQSIYFGHQPGVIKGAAALPDLTLAFLRLSIRDAEFEPLKDEHSPNGEPARDYD